MVLDVYDTHVDILSDGFELTQKFFELVSVNVSTLYLGFRNGFHKEFVGYDEPFYYGFCVGYGFSGERFPCFDCEVFVFLEYFVD
ncbi:hypothetical protein OB919_21475 [Halobacteria archaeon AArc-curdl1]|uniref:Uncharacterized protein n=1 Tax=Natronosalvus hydrolyticus TaxID=2979988 RepID=A0AAP2ZC56_9EURY|nr:hypothetical protein [Halobacteria archaeon AArc-curdl1]